MCAGPHAGRRGEQEPLGLVDTGLLGEIYIVAVAAARVRVA
jgi:hypothetical protein